jgi:hypothetical protein
MMRQRHTLDGQLRDYDDQHEIRDDFPPIFRDFVTSSPTHQNVQSSRYRSSIANLSLQEQGVVEATFLTYTGLDVVPCILTSGRDHTEDDKVSNRPDSELMRLTSCLPPAVPLRWRADSCSEARIARSTVGLIECQPSLDQRCSLRLTFKKQRPHETTGNWNCARAVRPKHADACPGFKVSLGFFLQELDLIVSGCKGTVFD